MSAPYRPVIQTQADLETAWRRLVNPLGFHCRSLWLLMIGGDDRPIPSMTEIADLPDEPDERASKGLGELLQLLPPDDGGRWALLLSRPGSHPTDESDRSWAAAFYDTMRRHDVPHEVIHLATDAEILPVPLDDVSASTTLAGR
jgi:hypothetical protein